jgi:hypothetical protein
MAERDSVILPNDRNKLSDLINEQLVALNKALIENRGNSVAVSTITTLQEGLKTLLKNLFEKKGVITPDETNVILDKVDSTKRTIMRGQYINDETNYSFLKLLAIIVVAIFTAKLIKK